MSFSGDVKEELLKYHDNSIQCAWIELAAILFFGTKSQEFDGQNYYIMISGENDLALRKGFTLCQKNINIKADIVSHMLVLSKEFPWERTDIRQKDFLMEDASKRAFLRGAFLCIGSMSNPEKSYHMEFDCCSVEEADLLIHIMEEFQLEAKRVERKKYQVVYIKEGSAISDLLNIMGAHVSLMNFENDRIVKEVRNSVNRQVNCETANIAKTVSAATKQVQDIMLIRDSFGLDGLQQGLQEIAIVRLENPEATLQELGALLNPPVGKSGVNHRLRKLSEIAGRIRKQ